MRRTARSTVLILVLTTSVTWAFAQQPPARPAKPATAPAAPPAVATVGALRIPRVELDQRVEQALGDYRRRAGTDVPAEFRTVVERQLLETMVRNRLLQLEAQRQHLAGSDAEALETLRRDPFFLDQGHFSEQRFQAAKTQDPVHFNLAIQQIKEQLGAMELGRRLEKRLMPDEAKLRSDGERALQAADLDVLGLYARDFVGTFEEPREQEILDYYRDHAAESRRPEQVRLTVVFVDQPPLADSLADDLAALRAWDASMHERADGILAALRAGATLDSVAATCGGLKRDVVVQRASYPRFWAGSPQADEAVFATTVGDYVPVPVQALPGWLVARVESRSAEHAATLKEVALDIRQRLRRRALESGDAGHLQELYAARRDSLAGPGIRVLYAAFDTARVALPEPSGAELDRFYRGHLADYSSYDSEKSAIVVRPLAEVRADVRLRWSNEHRLELARSTAERLYRTWAAGRRDPAAERLATTLREVGPFPVGALPDSGLAALALGDSLAAHPGVVGAGLGEFARGQLVWRVLGIASRVTPTFDQALPELRREWAERRQELEEAGARALWQRDPTRFNVGKIMNAPRLLVPKPELLDVELTRADVESWYHDHLSDYVSGESVHARHILIMPKSASGVDVEAARKTAAELVEKLHAGQAFADLARRYSDDVATREKGGDLGSFGRGAMREAFERAAFALQPGQISAPVRTEEGWHVIECLDHHTVDAAPLERIYTAVGMDCARDKADRIAFARTDSLLPHIKTVADAQRIAAQTGLQIIPSILDTAEPLIDPDDITFMQAIVKLKPREIYPRVRSVKGVGYCITWVDSIMPPAQQTWEQARVRVLSEYRAEAARRSFDAKRAELDSMLAGGWTFDSLGVLFGGLDRVDGYQRQGSLRRLGTAPPRLDSLVFGAGGGAAPLPPGAVTDWVEFPSGSARVRLVARREAAPSRLAAYLDRRRRADGERAMRGYFDELQKRYKVRILDPRLAQVHLPELPEQGD